MKQTSDNVGFPRTRNFLRLWSAVAQRMFPFMIEELGELDDMARLFVMLCESVVKPEDFDYAKWSGIERPKIQQAIQQGQSPWDPTGTVPLIQRSPL